MFISILRTDPDGSQWKSYETITVPDGFGKPTQVRKLSELEAKAMISEEYGFEIACIRILADCWYEATDWNYFKFSVCGRWGYEAKNYGPLEVLDWKGGEVWDRP